MKLRLSIIFFVVLLAVNVNAQPKGVNDTIKVHAFISEEGDTLALSYLPLVELTTIRKLTIEQKQQRAEWTRLRNAVYITYPYAKAASKIMNEINAKLAKVTDKSQRKAIIKSREKELRKEFTSRLSDLSIYQGKVLMKLIHRETGNNCYEIIKEYKGGFNAILYQTVALIVGTNLKQYYDANNADKPIEIIVKDLEKMYGYKG